MPEIVPTEALVEEPDATATEEDLADKDAPDALEDTEATEEALVVDPVPPPELVGEPPVEELAPVVEAFEELGEEFVGVVVGDDGVEVELDGVLVVDEELPPRVGPVPGMREADTPVELVQPLGTGPGPPAVNLIAAHCSKSQYCDIERRKELIMLRKI